MIKEDILKVLNSDSCIDKISKENNRLIYDVSFKHCIILNDSKVFDCDIILITPMIMAFRKRINNKEVTLLEIKLDKIKEFSIVY